MDVFSVVVVTELVVSELDDTELDELVVSELDDTAAVCVPVVVVESVVSPEMIETVLVFVTLVEVVA